MGRPRAVHECVGCGKPTPRRGRMSDGVRCLECSISRQIEASKQMRAKKGEHYDRWLEGMKAAIKRQEERPGRAVEVSEGDTPS